MLHPLGRQGFLKSLLSITGKPQSGTLFSVRAATTHHGPSMRFIANLANWDDSVLLIPAGESGQLGSGHYTDQFSYWYEGKPIFMPFTDPAEAKTRRHTSNSEALSVIRSRSQPNMPELPEVEAIARALRPLVERQLNPLRPRPALDRHKTAKPLPPRTNCRRPANPRCKKTRKISLPPTPKCNHHPAFQTRRPASLVFQCKTNACHRQSTTLRHPRRRRFRTRQRRSRFR